MPIKEDCVNYYTEPLTPSDNLFPSDNLRPGPQPRCRLGIMKDGNCPNDCPEYKPK